eukprot:975768-Heterocapsa_arctica.AAC.1
MHNPAELTPVERVDYHWALEMRNIWQGTQLCNAWVQDRSMLLAAWGMVICPDAALLHPGPIISGKRAALRQA